MLYKLSSLDACELSRQSPGCFHRPPAFVLVKMSRVLHRGMFFCKRGLFKKLAHLLYYFLCNVFYHYFSLSLMDFGPSVVRPLLLSGCMNLWWLDAEGIVHRRWVWIFASEMTERRVTSDLPGGSSPWWCIAAIYGRMWTEPWRWDLHRKEQKMVAVGFIWTSEWNTTYRYTNCTKPSVLKE